MLSRTMIKIPPHYSIQQTAVITLVTQMISFVVSAGFLTSATAQVIVPAATAFVNVGFLIANSIHANAHAKVAAAMVTPLSKPAPTHANL